MSLHVRSASVSDLWDLECIGITDPAESKTKTEGYNAAKEHFLKTVSRSAGGRYTVRLPWVDGVRKIPDNRIAAKRGLESTTEKLLQSGTYDAYNNLFKEWEEEGIIEEVKKGERKSRYQHFLPHRAVYKPESQTTPIRPVFDASYKSGRIPSLNDCLEKGPNLIDLIPGILNRFRKKKIGVVSDIRRAFLMVEVAEEERDFLSFLWWQDLRQKVVKVYRHCRVVFGVNCSPFLLGAVIELHLRGVKDKERLVANKLFESLYINNCITSLDSIQDCVEFKKQATLIMGDAGMKLRCWEFGTVETLRVGLPAGGGCGLSVGRATVERSGIDSPNGGECGLDFDSLRILNQLVSCVLGLNWDKTTDSLFLTVEPKVLSEVITKPKILFHAHKLYDPLGFCCPVLLQPKVMLQKLWAKKIGWDDTLTEEDSETFRRWWEETSYLKDMRIPRHLTGGVRERETWQFHVFSDASQETYAVDVFLRTVNERGEISVQLVQAKSRVTSKKKVSIPRLELLGCLIATRLYTAVKKSLKAEGVPTFFWCDSTTALSWIQRNDDK